LGLFYVVDFLGNVRVGGSGSGGMVVGVERYVNF